MTIMNVQLCIAVTYFYDYFEAKLVPNILLIAENRLWGALLPKPPQRGFTPVPHWELQADPLPR